MVASNVGSRKAPRLGNVLTGPVALPYHDVVYLVVVLSIWAVHVALLDALCGPKVFASIMSL